MKKNHKFFSNLAFNLAENNLGKTSINPSVGCIIVKNNSVVSSGVTSVNGRPHAEFNALNKKGNFRGSNMYVTLEPCAHYGVSPPCTNIIKKKKIKNVFYCFNDPDLRTNGLAKRILLQKKIKLKKIKSFRNSFYDSYFLNKNRGLPLLDAKLALSKDEYTINKKSKRITNNRSREVSHLIRSRYDSIISTSKTINKDNALLNCRINGFNNYKPDLLVIDRNLKLKTNLRLFKIAKKRKTYIFTTSKNKKKIAFLKKKNCKVIRINQLDNKRDFLKLMNIIFRLGKRRILVEAGLIFISKLLDLKLINLLFVFRSKKRLKKNGYNNMNLKIVKKCKFIKKIKVNLNEDELYTLKG
tara:strand:+ start:441 stop:1505 length:1065 start_codon:yes stop_codon:yes gene_type:complete